MTKKPLNIVIHHSLLDDLAKTTTSMEVFGAMLNTVMKMDDEEFQVNTPKKDGGKKKNAKYGWMKDPKGNLSLYDQWGNQLGSKSKSSKTEKKVGVKSGTRRSVDAIFIAPTIGQATHYRKVLNYDPKSAMALTPRNYKRVLESMRPDEDLAIHLCGSWLNENVDTDTFYQLDDVIYYLIKRGFDYVEVPEIGKF